MNKLIALLRFRQEGFQTEYFEDDFIMDVPEELIRCFSLARRSNTARRSSGKRHRQLLSAQTAKKVISDTCNDYNWGDFTFAYDQGYPPHGWSFAS